jgi:hypothetical protein
VVHHDDILKLYSRVTPSGRGNTLVHRKAQGPIRRASGIPPDHTEKYHQVSKIPGARAGASFSRSRPTAHWEQRSHREMNAWAKALTGVTSPPGKYPQLMIPPGSETGRGRTVTLGELTVCSVDSFGTGSSERPTTNSSAHNPFDWGRSVIAQAMTTLSKKLQSDCLANDTLGYFCTIVICTASVPLA